MTPENNQPSFLQRLGRAFGKTMRFLFGLVLIAAVAALIYFSVPYIYERVIRPLDANTEELAAIEAKQADDVAELTGQISDLKARISELENRQTESAQLLSALEGQVIALDEMVAKQTLTLKQLDEMQANIGALLDVSAEHEDLLTGENSVVAALHQEVMFSRVIELLSRGRLYLSQSNFGLAKADIQSARDLLAQLEPEIAEEQSAVFQDVIQRLDLAIKNLPGFPVVAVDDIDAAWELLISRLPEDFETIPLEGTPTADAAP
jgi:hypothetical protein